jgi:hypothetical protein
MSAESQKMLYFAMLTRTEQAQAIHRLAQSGVSDYGIAAASGLSVEMVRKILGELLSLEAAP